jgi:glutathione S-transferase
VFSKEPMPTMSNAKTAARELPTLTLCELDDPGLEGVESYSPFCLKVHRALGAAGLRYVRRHGTRPAAFKSLNPAGQVPVLLVGDEAVSDSTAIVARITALAPGALDAERDPARAAEARLWEELADTSLNGLLVAARWADERNWPAVRAAYFSAMPAPLRAVLVPGLRRSVLRALHARDVTRHGAAALWQRFEQTLDQLDARAPARGYWLGASLSVADVALFGQLHSLRTPLTRWQAEALARRAGLAGYLDRVDAATRPGGAHTGASRGAGVAAS